MSEQRRRGPMGGHGRMMSGEKAKDFKGTMKKLMRPLAAHMPASGMMIPAGNPGWDDINSALY